MTLVDYGIHNEQSDIRVHVCPIARRIYIYPTQSGIAILETGQYSLRPGFQNGIEGATAEGFLVPPMDIPRCVSLSLRSVAWEAIAFSDGDGLSEKGRKATRLIVGMIKNGLFPFPASAKEEEDLDIQILGTDITVILTGRIIKIQVKCDYPGGEREFGGTGNLFLQVAERNPNGVH